MLKLFLLSSLLVLNINAFDVQMASKIFDKIFLALIHKNSVAVYVYSKDEKYKELVIMAEHLDLIEDINGADIVLVNDSSNIPNNISRVLFTTDVKFYKEHPNSIGVFYWKYGRPKIIFSKERLKKFNIQPDKKWEKFIKSDKENDI